MQEITQKKKNKSTSIIIYKKKKRNKMNYRKRLNRYTRYNV